ncbi:MAG: serine--tRNA ligase [Planctomycetota bacterium]|nr:MAG: serine--tRNA ligase [Planctomycetota bacterium]
MLDIRVIRDNLEAVRAGAALKRIEVDLDRLVVVDDERRRLIRSVEDGKAEQRKRGKALGQLSDEQRPAELAALGQLKSSIQAGESALAEVLVEYEALMLQVPNIPAPEVPQGATDAENVLLREEGSIPEVDFERLDHVDLGQRLRILDIERGVKLSGTRFYVLRGGGALLHRAVLNFAFDHMVSKGFEPFEVPLLVRDPAMVGTAYFPGGEDQAYRLEKDRLNLVGTAEVPLTAFHSGDILDEAELPQRFVARSACFRREAGAAGKDTRGLYRIHQFEKVEQVVILPADEEASREEHLAILKHSEELLAALELPYRVVNVCGGDLGQPQIQKYDIETWMPSRGAYGETHSASRFHEFQARRLGLRYRDGEGTIRFCHTLNNTVAASPRILIPILELYQQSDGSVVVPDVLRPYMAGLERIEAPTV